MEVSKKISCIILFAHRPKLRAPQSQRYKRGSVEFHILLCDLHENSALVRGIKILDHVSQTIFLILIYSPDFNYTMSQQQISQSQSISVTSATTSNTLNSNSIPKSDKILLFACTKCNSRHRFEELSKRHQLCRTCKSTFSIISCDFCRTEFKQEAGAKPASICKKCEQLQEQYGKPDICSCCNVKAAFIGNKCQRCNNSEKKYGPPMNCENCHQKCAFDRPDPEGKAKVDGKMLCWLCTIAFKRSLAKSKHKQDLRLMKSSASSSSRLKRNSPIKTGLGDTKDAAGNYKSSGHHTHHQHQHQHQHHHRRHKSPNSAGHKTNVSNSGDNHIRSSNSNNRRPHHHSSSHHRETSNLTATELSVQSTLKRPRIDQRSNLTSNGHLGSTNVSSLTESRFMDPNGTDMTAVITQLKDQIAVLNRRLNLKEKDILSKDQQVSAGPCLKSTAHKSHSNLSSLTYSHLICTLRSQTSSLL